MNLISLEEIPDDKLREELLRRDKLRMKNKCAYCGRTKGVEPSCKMTEEHASFVVETAKESGKKTKREELEEAKKRVLSELLTYFDTSEESADAILLFHVVEGAGVYWADNPLDFALQTTESSPTIVFGGHNRITWGPTGGYQMHRYACTDAFIERYLSIGPNPSGYT